MIVVVISKKKRTILYIDGENFFFKAADILRMQHKIRHKSDIINFYFSRLVQSALAEFSVDEIRFYAARVHLHKDDANTELERKSRIIIESQRRLKRCLTNDGVNFIFSGNVRLQDTVPAKKGTPAKYIFKEKGTDVQLAVDVLSAVCDGEVNTVLLLSSDSDMQPVVREVRKRGGKIVYIGFEEAPNLGLSNRCHQTVLLRKSEVVDAWEGRQKKIV